MLLINRESEYIKKILSEGSFSAAAQKLYISQPSLSQYIKRIENIIGSELFERTSKPLKLTNAGKIYLETEEKINFMRKQMRQRLDDIDELKQGHLTIGSSHYRSAYLLTKVLPVFRKKYSGITISLEEGTTSQLEEYAINGITDFSISLLPTYSPVLGYEELFDENILLAISDEHPLCKKMLGSKSNDEIYPKIDFGQLKDTEFIIMKHGQKLRKSFFDLCEQAGFSPKIILESQSMVAAQALAAVGFGATLVPDVLAMYNHLTRAPLYFSFINPPPKRHVVAVYNKNKYLSKAAQAFIAMIKEIVIADFKKNGYYSEFI